MARKRQRRKQVIWTDGDTNTVKMTVFKVWAEVKQSMKKAEQLATWQRGEQLRIDPSDSRDVEWHGQPFTPRDVNNEYEDLITRSPGQWAGLIVNSLSQTSYINGVRRGGSKDNLKVWEHWRRNNMQSLQIPLNKTALGQGQSFAVVELGTDPLTGARRPLARVYSAQRFTAVYGEEIDDWATFGVWARKRPTPTLADGVLSYDSDSINVWDVRLVDEVGYHTLTCKNDGTEISDWTYITTDYHDFPVAPIARFVGDVDLEGNATGVIEPVIPLLRRVDQDTFDRLIVQRFGAWKVRWISGMQKPRDGKEYEELRIQDFLGSESKDTKFGTLEGTQIDGFLKAGQDDLRQLSALTQIPPHHLLGLSDNLQAEALAAAEAGLQRRSKDFRTINGNDGYTKLFRLFALADKTMAEEASYYDLEVQYEDTESRSLVQALQALGTAATQLQVPVTVLWEKIPGWSDVDQQRALEAVESGEADRMIAMATEAAMKQAATGGGGRQDAGDVGEARRNAGGQ